MTRPALLRHRLADAAERELREEPRPCDTCGARVAGLVREEVEGVTCERCPTCRQGGAVP